MKNVYDTSAEANPDDNCHLYADGITWTDGATCYFCGCPLPADSKTEVCWDCRYSGHREN